MGSVATVAVPVAVLVLASAALTAILLFLRSSWLRRGATTMLVAVFLFSGYWLWYELSVPATWQSLGDDPRIVQERGGVSRGGFAGGPGTVSGVLKHDPDSGCLYLEHVSHSHLTTVTVERAAVVWPKATRPIRTDGRRGVAVDSLMGMFGGTKVLEGDRVQSEGELVQAGGRLADYVLGGCPGHEAIVFFVERKGWNLASAVRAPSRPGGEFV